jgi:hypothetical protein
LLAAQEQEDGWVEHVCDQHGFLVATTPRAHVTCKCGKVARILRSGRIVDEVTLRPTSATARMLNSAGHPSLYGCDQCGEDFGGKTILRRHRTKGQCRTVEQMRERGWNKNRRGRWSLPAPKGLAMSHSRG